MESLHDRKLQSLVSSIKQNTFKSYHVYPDFNPSTLPKLRVNFEDMMKVAPEPNFENAYNVQQQMRNADANNQQYRQLFLETVDRDIQTIKSQLGNPNTAKDTSDHLFEELELKLKSKLEPTDPSFNQKNNAIQTELTSLKAQYERQEANMIIKDYKFMASISGDPMISGVFADMPSITQSYNKLVDNQNKREVKRLEYTRNENEKVKTKTKEKFRHKTLTDQERIKQGQIENYIPNLFDEEGNMVVEPAVEPAMMPAGAPPAGAPDAEGLFGGLMAEPVITEEEKQAITRQKKAEAIAKKKKKPEGGGGGGASETKGGEGPIIISSKPTLKAGLDSLLQKVKDKYGPSSTSYEPGMTTAQMIKEIKVLEAKKMIKSTGLEDRDTRLRETKGKKKK